jgi:hypothetical protein
VNLLSEATHHTGALILYSLLPGCLTAQVILTRRSSSLTRRRAARTRSYGRVKVVPSRITPEMRVPALDGTSHHGDFECGHIAWTLFQEAVTAGALTAPDGVRIECYPDRDIMGGGFVLVAFPDAEAASWGVTTGYQKAELVGVEAGFDTDDPQAVTKALDLFADELNSALSGLDATSQTSHTGPGPQLPAPSQAASPTPAANAAPPVGVAANASECVHLILDEAAIAPQRDVPGLICALECVLSLDDRDAASLVAQARAARTHPTTEAPATKPLGRALRRVLAGFGAGHRG